LYEDLPFRFELAGARKYLPTPAHLQVCARTCVGTCMPSGLLHLGMNDPCPFGIDHHNRGGSALARLAEGRQRIVCRSAELGPESLCVFGFW
jgi:hypothetical protein